VALQIKICGLKDAQLARYAHENGANFLGFIHFEKSPRHLSLNDMASLMTEIRSTHPMAKLVSVVVDPEDSLLEVLASRLKPDFIQLHGKESPERVAEIKQRFHIPLIKAISVLESGDIATASAYEAHVDYLLFDAKTPKGSDLPGGMGVRFDWKIMGHYNSPKPYFLAGGIDINSVDQAISETKTRMIDVSSGVELQPGLKDATRLKAFLDHVTHLKI